MAWWVCVALGFIAGSLFGMLLLAILAVNRKDDNNE